MEGAEKRAKEERRARHTPCTPPPHLSPTPNHPPNQMVYAFWGSFSRSSTAGESAASSHAVLPSMSCCGVGKRGGGGLTKNDYKGFNPLPTATHTTRTP